MACRKHKFEARFDTKETGRAFNIEESWGWSPSDLRDFATLQQKIYVRDVCVKCGKTIERLEDLNE